MDISQMPNWIFTLIFIFSLGLAMLIGSPVMFGFVLFLVLLFIKLKLPKNNIKTNPKPNKQSSSDRIYHPMLVALFLSIVIVGGNILLALIDEGMVWLLLLTVPTALIAMTLMFFLTLGNLFKRIVVKRKGGYAGQTAFLFCLASILYIVTSLRLLTGGQLIDDDAIPVYLFRVLPTFFLTLIVLFLSTKKNTPVIVRNLMIGLFLLSLGYFLWSTVSYYFT